ncbi:MAG: alpha-N-arabinofuranosidase [Oscillospiraceae bacterium]|nr:alpha-N-arabinofuranosidase [Oscillospiraceae bacterium]
MKKGRIIIDREFQLAETDPRIYGSFIEHLGRAVYQGIYQPGNKFADENGFRRDTLDLIREIDVPVVRYPGGNFVSNYNWEDGVGPKDKRPKRLDLAWKTIEPNQFGLDEFVDWCRIAGTEPMMAVNLGTRGAEQARDIVEYCNIEKNSKFADMRIANGHKDPHNIKLWCLGNEMDGVWQTCAKTPMEYARLAEETAKMMRVVDPSIELVACGSCGINQPTFGIWDSTVLERCYNYVNYLSMHMYFAYDKEAGPADFLANTLKMDEFIRSVVAVCDYVKAITRSKKEMYISFDEWNVWYHSNEADAKREPWCFYPPLLEDVYNFMDALTVGSMLITLLKHADRVKIACLAQLVNVIAPIMTSDTGAWRQTIFYPYMHASRYGRGTVLQTKVDCDKYDSRNFTDVPYLDSVVVDGGDRLTIFAVNRDLEEDMDLTADLRQYKDYHLAKHIEMSCDDLMAVNTEADPFRVAPTEKGKSRFEDGVLSSVIGKQSWNVIILEK